MHNRKDQLHQLLSPLCFLLQLSGEAYKKYLANKIYLHAETIRSSNKKIHKLIRHNTAFIPQELRDDILQLIVHYDAWLTQFKKHKKKLKPALDEEFVFLPIDDQSAYPRQAEERIFNFTKNLELTLLQAQTVENDI